MCLPKPSMSIVSSSRRKGPGCRWWAPQARVETSPGVQKLFETANTTRWSKIFRPAGVPYTLWLEPMSVSW